MDHLLLLTLTISLMFTGGQCASQSMSCSTVNGKTVCEEQKSDGNFAGAASNAMFGQGGSYQDASAMTGNSNTGQSSSSRTAMGNMPPGGFGFGPAAGAFAGAPPTFGGEAGRPADTSASDSANIGTGSTFFTGTSGSDGTRVGGAFAGSAVGGFAGSGAFGGPAAGGFAGSGAFFGGGFPPSFGVVPTFGDGSSVPSGTSAGDSGYTGTARTFIKSGSDATDDGVFAGPSSGAFVGSAAGRFDGPGDSGGFAGGGFPPSFGDGSSVPSGTCASDSGNTGTARTFVTSGSDATGDGVFAGPSSGVFVGSAVGGFAGGGFPPSFGIVPTFGNGASVLSGTSASDSANTGTARTFVTSGSDATDDGVFAGPSSGAFVGSAVGGFAGGPINPAAFNPFAFVFGGR